jgi:hypothetical protein
LQIRKDIWRCGIIPASLPQILQSESLDGWPLTWLPGSGDLRYLADPFGIWRQNQLYVFAEHFDYRDARGRIALSVYDSALTLLDQALVLSEPWHLSYPYVFEAEGVIWMLPESFESGALWLYRAVDFPKRWERSVRIELDAIPLDATPYHDGERWWLFYAPAFPQDARLTHLHVAWSLTLEGPWHSSEANPVFVDKKGARPGGTPFRFEDSLLLPVQSCVDTYGAAIRMVRIDRLVPDAVDLSVISEWRAPSSAIPYLDGCHTMSGAGPFTLIDVKQTKFSAKGLFVRPLRKWHRQKRAMLPYRW